MFNLLPPLLWLFLNRDACHRIVCLWWWGCNNFAASSLYLDTTHASKEKISNPVKRIFIAKITSSLCPWCWIIITNILRHIITIINVSNLELWITSNNWACHFTWKTNKHRHMFSCCAGVVEYFTFEIMTPEQYIHKALFVVIYMV